MTTEVAARRTKRATIGRSIEALTLLVAIAFCLLEFSSSDKVQMKLLMVSVIVGLASFLRGVLEVVHVHRDELVLKGPLWARHFPAAKLTRIHRDGSSVFQVYGRLKYWPIINVHLDQFENGSEVRRAIKRLAATCDVPQTNGKIFAEERAEGYKDE